MWTVRSPADLQRYFVQLLFCNNEHKVPIHFKMSFIVLIVRTGPSHAYQPHDQQAAVNVNQLT
jgi:hypothetical protein